MFERFYEVASANTSNLPFVFPNPMIQAEIIPCRRRVRNLDTSYIPHRLINKKPAFAVSYRVSATAFPKPTTLYILHYAGVNPTCTPFLTAAVSVSNSLKSESSLLSIALKA